MKKTLAGILIVAFLCGSSACNNHIEKPSETETTTSSEVTVSETEVSESEPFEISETASDITDTSESSDATVMPSWQPEPAETIEVDHSMEILDIATPDVSNAYGALDPTTGRVMYIATGSTRLEIQNEGYAELKEELGKIFDEKESFFEDLYNESIPVFLSEIAEGKSLMWVTGGNDIRVFRADEKIVSFSENTAWTKELSEDQYEGDNSTIYYNFHSKTGKRGTLDDVVADKEGLCDCIRNVFQYSMSKWYGDETEWVEAICMRVMDGSVQFYLLYDGIMLEEECRFIHLSAANYPGIFNMVYFLSVPENYVLISDSSGVMTWDLNSDGKTEKIFLSEYTDSAGNRSAAINIGGVETMIENDFSYDVPDPDYSFYLAHTSEGFFLLAGGHCGSDDRCEIIFRIKDDFSAEFVETGVLYSTQEYDPEKWEFMSIDDAYSAGYFLERESYSSFTLTGEKTVNSKEEQHGLSGSVMVTKMDIKCKIREDADTWKEYTLPKGTAVCVIGYSPAAQELILEILHPDNKDNQQIRISYDTHTFDGVDPFELFEGITVGG